MGYTIDKGDYVACDTYKTIETFDKEIDMLEVTPLPLELAGCVDMFIADSLLICKQEGRKHYWNIISLNSNVSYGQYIRKGHGNDEFEQMPYAESIKIIGDSIYCNFYESASDKFYTANLSKSIKDGQIAITDKKNIKVSSDISDIIEINDSTHFVVKFNNFNGFIRSTLIKNSTEKEIKCGNLNTILSEDVNNLASTRTVNVNKQLVAEAMLRFSQINLYAMDGDSLNVTLSLHPELESLSSVEGLSKMERRKYFGGVISTDAWFAAIYHDVLLKDYFENNADKSSVMFFTWKGEPIVKLNIPFSATSIGVYGEYMYILNANSEKECIYKYKLPSEVLNVR